MVNNSPQCDVNSSYAYDSETKAAYLFACAHNITTERTIDKAIATGNVYRDEMAKMLVNFAVNVLGKKLDTTKTCQFTDTTDEDSEMKGYMTEACQLGLMGYEGDGVTQSTTFNPQDTVTRAQFGTVVSRLLWGDKYNTTATDTGARYSGHLNALQKAGIITVITPDILEQRGFVWIIFQRIAEKYPTL